jgi:hypothetical protein
MGPPWILRQPISRDVAAAWVAAFRRLKRTSDPLGGSIAMGSPTVGVARRRSLALLFAIALVGSLFPAAMVAAEPPQPPTQVGHDPEVTPARARPSRIRLDGGTTRLEEQLLKRDDAFITARTAGDNPLSDVSAGRARAIAHKAAKALKKAGPPISPLTFTDPWTEISPNPIVQVTRGKDRWARHPAQQWPEDPRWGPGRDLDL